MAGKNKNTLYASVLAAAAGVIFAGAFLYSNVPQASVVKPRFFFAAAPPANTAAIENTATENLPPDDNQPPPPAPEPEPTGFPVADTEIANKQTLSPVEPPVSPIFLQAAATQNARLRYNLAWAFGGKSQHGWFLYESLIQKTIGAERKEPGTPEFARALLAWQARFGLAPTATLDDKTLYKLVEYWQSRRLNSSEYPTPDKLLTAPIADFYDPSRDIELTKVERQTYAAYKRLVAAAAKDKTLNLKLTPAGELAPEEKFLKIVSSFRSREYQNKLRQQSPNSGRAGLATNSPHFTGRALDIYVGGEPVTTKDFNRAEQVQTPVYKWLVANAERFGFYPYYYEPWHWEYVGERNVTPAQTTK